MKTRSFREEVLWLAGLLEGEGTFGWNNGTPRIGLGMTDHDVVHRAHELLRATAKLQIKPRSERRQTVYTVVISGARAVGWMMMLYPFLGERRRGRLWDILMMWRSRPIFTRYRQSCPRGHPLSARDGQRQRYCPECRETRNRARYWGQKLADSPHQMGFGFS